MAPGYRQDKYKFIKRRNQEVAYGADLARLITRLKPEIIVSGNTPTEPQWTMIRAARALGIPVISWIQDFYSLAVGKLARKKLPLIGLAAGAWYRHLDRKCLAASAGVVAITEDFLPILAQFGVDERRVAVIPNWAPLEELPLRPKANAWAIGNRLSDHFVFIYSGTLAMKHNPDLLRQLAVAFKGDPQVRIVVISEGPGVEFLRGRKASEGLDNLLLIPFQPFEDMPDVLAAADVLAAVLETDAGVFSVPSKILTYHCAGRAILGAIPAENLAARIIQKQQTGLCVEPRDEAGFLNAARTLRQDAGLRNAMAGRARHYAEREFDINQIVDRFDTVFKKALTPIAHGPR